MLRFLTRTFLLISVLWTSATLAVLLWLGLQASPQLKIFLLGGDHTASATLADQTEITVDVARPFLRRGPNVIDRRISICRGSWISCETHWVTMDYDRDYTIEVLIDAEDQSLQLGLPFNDVETNWRVSALHLDASQPGHGAQCLGVFGFINHKGKLAERGPYGRFQFNPVPEGHIGNCWKLFR